MPPQTAWRRGYFRSTKKKSIRRDIAGTACKARSTLSGIRMMVGSEKEDTSSSGSGESTGIGLAAKIISVQNTRRLQYTVVTIVAIYQEVRGRSCAATVQYLLAAQPSIRAFSPSGKLQEADVSEDETRDILIHIRVTVGSTSNAKPSVMFAQASQRLRR